MSTTKAEGKTPTHEDAETGSNPLRYTHGLRLRYLGPWFCRVEVVQQVDGPLAQGNVTRVLLERGTLDRDLAEAAAPLDKKQKGRSGVRICSGRYGCNGMIMCDVTLWRSMPLGCVQRRKVNSWESWISVKVIPHLRLGPCRQWPVKP